MSQLELNEMHFISYGTCELKTCTGSIVSSLFILSINLSNIPITVELDTLHEFIFPTLCSFWYFRIILAEEKPQVQMKSIFTICVIKF
mgnify:CR=1 FL=1